MEFCGPQLILIPRTKDLSEYCIMLVSAMTTLSFCSTLEDSLNSEVMTLLTCYVVQSFS